MLELEPRDDECALSRGAEQERDRPFGRVEGEPGVVEDVVRVEQHDAGETVATEALEKRVAAGTMLFGRDGDRGRHVVGSLWSG